MSIGDRLKGAAHEIGGKIKEAGGVLKGDPKLRQEGRSEQAEGEMRQEIEKDKEQVKGGAQELKGRVERVAGAITGDTGTQIKGKMDELGGQARRKISE